MAKKAKSRKRSGQTPAEASAAAPAPTSELTAEKWVLNTKDKIKRRPMVSVVLVVLVIGAAIGLTLKVRQDRAEASHAFRALHDAIGDGDVQAETTLNELDSAELDDVLKKLDDLVAKYPTSSAAMDANFLIARINFQSGNYKDASRGFNKFVTESPGHQLLPAARYSYGACEMALGNFRAAITAFERVPPPTLDVSDPAPYISDTARYQAAVCAWRIGDFAQAKLLLDSVLKSEFALIADDARALARQMKVIPKDVMIQRHVDDAASPEDNAPAPEDDAPSSQDDAPDAKDEAPAPPPKKDAAAPPPNK